MTGPEFERHLDARASMAGLELDRRLIPALYAYYSLLTRWNRRINLTALPLDPPTDRTIDRLLVEPLAAAPLLSAASPGPWLDLGSGGGSPAIPLSLALDRKVTLVEARDRKAAFLRAVVRDLGLDAEVAGCRFEHLPSRGDVMLVTARAVRTSAEFFRVVDGLLARCGIIAVFSGSPPLGDLFQWTVSAPLAADNGSYLFIGKPRQPG